MPLHTKVILYPYNTGSHSARAIAQGLNTKCVRQNGTYRFVPGHLPVNWGNSHVPRWGTPQAVQQMLNKPQNVVIASDKIQTFTQLATAMGNDLVPWTTNRRVASEWLANPIYRGKLNAVVCRTLTRANSGRGIVLAKTPEELVNAPLYTRYKPKRDEYRIHASSRFGVIDGAIKLARNGVRETDGFNQYIRSHDNGWIFAREGLQIPAPVAAAAERAVSILGLDFGAVDIGFHPDHGISIYEVNTAPGVEGQTLANYISLFRRYLRGN